MEIQESKSNRDVTVVAIIISLVALFFIITASGLDSRERVICIMVLLLSFIVGVVGKERKIGFGWAFLASLFLTPLIGFILVLASSKMKDDIYKDKMIDVAEKTSSSLVADQLLKLNELKKEGILTEEEFNDQKKKILNW